MSILKKILPLLFVAAFAISISVPRNAYAQPIPVIATNPDIVTNDIARNIQETTDRTVFGSVVGSVTTSLINIMTYFANTAAHDAAVWLANGAPGDQPLIEVQPVEDYFIYAGANVASEVVNGLVAQNVDEYGRLAGLNVCAPPNLPQLRAGIRSNYQPTSLGGGANVNFCGDLNNFKDNWIGFFANIGDTITDPGQANAVILETLADSFDPSVSDFSVTLGLYTDTLLAAENRGRLSAMELLEKDGVWDVTDFITGQTTTPSSFVQNYYHNATYAATDLPGAIGVNLIGNSDALVQVGLSAGSIFANTLLSRLSERLADGLISPRVIPNPFDEFASGTSGRGEANDPFRSLLTFTPLDASSYNFLAELSTCPNTLRGTPRRLYNCVLNTNFATVLARSQAGNGLTVKQAVDQGLLNGNWALIPSSDRSANQDSGCYNYAFCHGNLVKMRKARIIPVGWELAAELPEASQGRLTLGQVMNGFNDCNAEGERDGDHPFCHLIDPNWVLKLPETSCRILANGQILSAAGVASRAEECVDLQTCIEEDENGQCVGGYGYCVQEENVWNFRGESCSAEYASCLGFESRTGQQGQYLTTTLDQAGCSEGNAGCLWYQTEKTAQTDGFDWPAVTDVAAALDAPDAYQTKSYFTAAISSCDSASGGCTELIEASSSRLNMVNNPGFERDTDADNRPDGWISVTPTSLQYQDSQANARSGGRALMSGGTLVYQPGILLNQGSIYTLSFYAKRGVANAAQAVQVSLRVTDEDGNEGNFATTSFDSANCTIANTNGLGGAETITLSGVPAGQDYERFTCTFSVPVMPGVSSVAYAELNVNGQGVIGSQSWIDDVQLEAAGSAGAWIDGYGISPTSIPRTYMKLAPAYLECDGINDPEECAAYAPSCAEGDVGCTSYTPVNGDPSVTGVASALDRCDEGCVGYDTFKQEPTRYEPTGDFPVYFIPSTAEQCRAEAVGCDEFTNLATEATEYFTYLRGCATEAQAGADASIFYTWEGSDVEGYQLRTWNLLESNIASTASETYPSGFTETAVGSAPCIAWDATADGVVCNETIDDVRLAAAEANCDEHNDIFVNPDCREFYDALGNIHYRDWRNTVSVDNSCTVYRKTDLAGLGSDSNADAIDDGAANCSGSGGYFDTATNACLYFGLSTESAVCSAAENGCREYTGGQSRNSRVVLNDNFEIDLTNWTAASATAVTLSNESVAAGGQSLYSTGGVTVSTHVFNLGSACTDPAGCASPTGTLGGNCTVVNGQQYCGVLNNEIFAGKTYTLTFWAKGNGAMDVVFNNTVNGPGVDAVFADDLQLSPAWERYSVGPVVLSAAQAANFDVGTILSFDPTTASEFYIDNVILREGESNITIIRDSWVTPAMCDENFEGQVVPQFQLGCQEYTDQLNNTHFLKSFSRLCGDDMVGCRAFYDTSNSVAVNAQVFNATCSTLNGLPVSTRTACHLQTVGTGYDLNSPKACDIAPGASSCQFDLEYYLPDFQLGSGAYAHISYDAHTQVVPQDHVVYAVYDASYTCAAGVAGCEEVALPKLSADQSVVEEWQSTFVLNDPDRYADILCDDESLFCEEWSAGSEGTWYFRNPLAKTCEYKENVSVNGVQYNGWFRTGTTNFCYGTGVCSDNTGISCSLDSECAAAGAGTCRVTQSNYLIGGTDAGVWRNGDASYSGWVGTCPEGEDGCSEFIDTLDVASATEYATPNSGASYYFLDDDSLDDTTLLSSERCNGRVSQTLGCVLFEDTGNTSLTFNASATLVKSEHADAFTGGQPFDLVDPVDCSSGSSLMTTSTGEVVDLCAQRCVYDRSRLQPSFSSSSASDLYTLGGSCYVDTDCLPVESFTGDLVSGTCETSLVDPSGTFATQAVPRLQNDTNRVLKVNRDRECSEWLAPSDTRPVFDQSIGAWREISSGLTLCSESNEEGCINPVINDPAVVLDVNRYAARNVGWYGEEYSGYSLPNSYPVQHLDQVNIAPAQICLSVSGTPFVFNGEVTVCETDADCGSTLVCGSNPEEDYRLAFDAGSCSAGLNHGDSCTVGYCSETGSPCAGDGQCGAGGGSCIIGEYYSVGSTGADSQADCSAGQVFVAGTCYNDVGDCSLAGTCINGSCGAGVCFQSVATTEGTCYRDSCVVGVDGEQIAEDSGEVHICRAYPEATSPFDSSLVTQWIGKDGVPKSSSEVGDPIVGGGLNQSSVSPFSTVSGYENANFCAPGEDCMCSYVKISDSSNQFAYLDLDTDPYDSTTPYSGVCSGGALAGSICTEDTDCGDVDSGAVCQPINRLDTLYGMEGFCLERDTSINIDGTTDVGACITWYPVDQLQGTTDLYAKYKTAGFFEDTFVCSDVRLFANLRTSDIQLSNNANQPGVACAEAPGVQGVNVNNSYQRLTSNADGCWQNAACPEGYFAVVGQPAPNANFGGAAGMCAGDGSDNDCPYACIPKNSFHASEANENLEQRECLAPSSDDAVAAAIDGLQGAESAINGGVRTSNFGNEVYTWAATSQPLNDRNDGGAQQIQAFSAVLNAYQDCVLPGVAADQLDSIYDFRTNEDVAITANRRYRHAYINLDVYPACKDLLQVSSSSGEGYAFTNKLFQGGVIASNNPRMNYSFGADNIAGAAKYSPSAINASDTLLEKAPLRIGACIANKADNEFAPGTPLPNAPVYDSNINFDTTSSTASTSFQSSSEESAWLNDLAAPTTVNCVYPYEEMESGALFYGVDGHVPSDPEISSLMDFGYDYEDVAFDDLVDFWTVEANPANNFYARATQMFASLNLPDTQDWFTWTQDLITPAANWQSTEYAPEYTVEDSLGGELAEADRALWDVRAAQGGPPRVRGLNTDRCFGDLCEEGQEDTITVNGQNSGTVIGQGGFLRVTANFFAFALPDQLPIRRVIVDWGDGDESGSPSEDNFFRNHRGLVQGDESTTLCSLNSEWGLTSESCSENYLSYTHTYTCNAVTLPGTSVCNADYSNTPCRVGEGDTAQCAFKPKVHVRDNWGWCAGTCNGEDGCFEGTVDTNSTAGLGTDPTERVQCDYQAFPDVLEPGIDPWIEFDGVILVSPR